MGITPALPDLCCAGMSAASSLGYHARYLLNNILCYLQSVKLSIDLLLARTPFHHGVELSSEDLASLEGKLAVITGANTGIGLATAQLFVRHGCTVVLACRNLEKAEKARQQLLATPVPTTKGQGSLPSDDRIIVIQIDTSSLKSVRGFVKKLKSEVLGKDSHSQSFKRI